MSSPQTADDLRVLAHELRSPAAALAALLEAWDDADEPRRLRLIEIAATAVASIERLLADAAPASVRLERVDVGALVRDAVDAAALRGPVTLVPPGSGLVVDGDPQRLRQALDNLIGNALGHSPDGAAVTVSAGRHDASVVVAVADEGEGIDPSEAARVFEPGVRLTRARPGQGLGLAVVREIARAHGGEVELESVPGAGATFRLVLPAASAAG
jgi:two-component system, OmpR family, sensor kinase